MNPPKFKAGDRVSLISNRLTLNGNTVKPYEDLPGQGEAGTVEVTKSGFGSVGPTVLVNFDNFDARWLDETCLWVRPGVQEILDTIESIKEAM